MSVALLLFFMTMVGGTLGFLFTGLLSDALRPAHGMNGLAYSLTAMTGLMLACAYFFWHARRTLVLDSEP